MGILERLVTPAYAVGASNTGIFTPVRAGTDFQDLIVNIINTILIIAAALAVIYLIYSGVQYITANGDATKATAARTGIINAIIGIVVILLAYAIVSWVAGAVYKGNPDSGSNGYTGTMLNIPRSSQNIG